MNKGAASPWSPGKVPPRALCWLLAILLAGGTVCLAQPLRYGENDSRAGIGAPGVNPHRISEDYDNDEDQEYDDDDEDDGIEADQNWDHDDEEGGDEEAGAESGLTADEARASDVGEWGDPELSPTREWTVLVYLDGDNDLEFPAIIDFLEMQHGMVGIDTDLVDVIVLFDRAEGYADLFEDWTDTRVYRILPSENLEEIESELLHTCGELNMGSPLTLENFIGEGMRMFPAPRTALVLWNHGGGWTSLLHDENAPGTETGSGHMTLEDVRVALSRAAVNYPDGKLDLLVLDMCLMGQAETLVAVNPFVKYLVASPPLAPGLGLDYAGGIPLFAAGLETADIAVGLVKTACKAYIEAEWLDASLAAYDLSKVGGLLSSFGALARKFDTLVPVAWSHLTRSIFYTRSFGGRTDLLQRSGTGTASSIDITDWLNRLEKLADPMLAREFSAEIEAVRKAIADIVIHCESGPLLPDSYGLAVYAPLREANYNNDYSGNAFGAYTDWSQALTDLYVEQRDNAGSPPRIFSIEFGQLAEPEADGGSLDIEPSSWFCFENDQNPHVKLTVDGINIMWVNAGFAVSETDDPYGRYLPLLRQTVLNSHIAVQTEAAKTVASADDELPVFRDGRNVFVYQMASHVTGISNGEEMTLVYPQFLDASEIDKAEIIGQLRRAGSQDYYFAIINTNGDEIVSVHVAVEDEVGNQYISAIMPDPADSFRPILKIIDEDGDESFEPGQEILWGDGPSLVRTLPPKGRYLKIMCMAESLAGEGSTALSEPIHITDPDGPAIAELDGDECDDEYYDEDDEEFADIGEFDEEEDGEYDDDNEYDDEGENE